MVWHCAWFKLFVAVLPQRWTIASRMVRCKELPDEKERPADVRRWSVLDDMPKRLVVHRWVKMSLSGLLIVASPNASSATYAHSATADCSGPISGLSVPTTHSNNNATMQVIHRYLLNSIFIAMCKCTVLFLNPPLKCKEICYYFAPSEMSSSLSPTCRCSEPLGTRNSL